RLEVKSITTKSLKSDAPVNVPDEPLNNPLTVSEPDAVTLPLPLWLIVRFLKVLAPESVWVLPLPLNVTVCVLSVNEWLLLVQFPASERSELIVTPFVLLRVRLFSAVTLLGTLTPIELPPSERLDEEVVERFVGVPAIAGPFSVSVFDPME